MKKRTNGFKRTTALLAAVIIGAVPVGELRVLAGETESQAVLSAANSYAIPQQRAVIPAEIKSDTAAIEAELAKLPLSFARSLQINRPVSALTTAYSKYFIMGTSDPSQTLTMDGKEVPRYGGKGAFGVLVPLEVGTNRFVFSQNGVSSTVEITRYQPSGKASPITKIVQSSIYPSVNDVAYADGEIEFQCTAPAGSRVTGSVAGLEVELTQTGTAENGVPATYYASVKVPSRYNVNEVTNLGKVSYTMRYQGQTSTYQSNANLYVAGENAVVRVRVNSYRANVLRDVNQSGWFLTTLNEGAVERISHKDYWSNAGVPYFYLSCGGYIPKASVTILEGRPSISNDISGVSLESSSRGETIRLSGTNSPSHKTVLKEGGLDITLYNSSLSAAMPGFSESGLIRSVTASSEDSSVTLHISLKKDLWGYDIQYDGDDTLIFIKERPRLSSDSLQPLKGTVVVLDPGHGDYDPGALGVAGTNGATESVLNLAVATAAKMRLEQLGATVYMTRTTTNEFLELDERMQFAEKYRPDFFLSVHHNSVGETVDANKTEGTEIYYHTSYSANMAKNILSGVCNNTGRKYRDAYPSYYRVTRITCAPAALVETGFVPNPAEYEKLCSVSNIIKAADGICEGILSSMPGAASLSSSPAVSEESGKESESSSSTEAKRITISVPVIDKVENG